MSYGGPTASGVFLFCALRMAWEKCGSLSHAQIFSGKEYLQFRASFVRDQFKTFAIGFPSENITDSAVITHRSRVEAEIDSCPNARKRQRVRRLDL